MKCSTILYCSTLVPRASRLPVHFSDNYAELLSSFSTYGKHLPNLNNASSGYEEVSVEFEPIRNGETFCVNNKILLYQTRLALVTELDMNKCLNIVLERLP